MKVPMSPRARVASGAVALVNRLSRRLGRGDGMVVGGWVGLFLDPHLLSDLTRSREVVLVSGTNGKTTTAALMRLAWGHGTGGNTTGANMPQGHVAALVSDRSPRMVLEVDEAYLGEIVHSTRPRAILLLNLSRDQLDRAAEVRNLALRWREALEGCSGVVANANDPLVVFAAETATQVRWVRIPTPWRKDAASCPHCTRPLRFGSEGEWWCDCGFRRPEDWCGHLRDGVVWLGERSVPLHLSIPGAVNEGNALIVLSTLDLLGGDALAGGARLAELRSVGGRYQVFTWRGRRIRLILAKNPAGYGEALASVDSRERLWIAINARIADGRDPSWLYDIDISSLTGREVMCLGERRLDLATRLVYGNVTAEVLDDPDSLGVSSEEICLVANYTAFREWRARLEAS
ncbi:MAG: DUF1727 domain-containing protein [Acidimicrobiaceae bacterium]|nr:DUF1727 domain-containing protein [Acidimicrobiaceae bacterium]